MCKMRMNIIGLSIYIILTTVVYSLCVEHAYANDSAAEITPRGIIFKREGNISIEKEKLYISLRKIEVSYVFKNNSSKDITTEIAFPLPDYKYQFDVPIPSFSDFSVEIDGQVIKYRKNIRALLNGKDYSNILNKMNISIADFGKFEENMLSIPKLNEKQRRELIRYGLISPEDDWPLWTVSIKYHWTQTFPANSLTNVKHSYTPYSGYEYFMFSSKADKQYNATIKDTCINLNTQKSIEKYFPKVVTLYTFWVSYILTTANNWDQPIKKFHLIIEKEEKQIMSCCFEHELSQISTNRYETTIDNFIPKKNLKVYFFSLKSSGK